MSGDLMAWREGQAASPAGDRVREALGMSEGGQYSQPFTIGERVAYRPEYGRGELGPGTVHATTKGGRVVVRFAGYKGLLLASPAALVRLTQ